MTKSIMLIAAACFLLAFSFLSNQPSVGTALARQSDAKQQDEPLRLKADLIEVRAVVTDKQGRIITHLKKDDFELLDKGKPQEISFFALERVGSGRSLNEDPNRAIRPGEGGGTTPQVIGRSVVLFVDTLHLSLSGIGPVKEALRRFVDEEMTDQDVVAIMTSTGTLGALEQFTRDRRILRHAIDKLAPWRTTKNDLFTPYLASLVVQTPAGGVPENQEPDALKAAIEIMKAEDPTLNISTGGFSPRDYIQREALRRANTILSEVSFLRRSLLTTLKAVVERMAAMPGQRLMVMMSEGFSMKNQGGTSDSGELRAAISRAVRSGVVIYSLDAKGLEPPPIFDASTRGLAVSGAVGGLITGYVSAGEKELQDGMNALAKDTGGDTFFNTNDLKGAILEAFDNNRIYYTLSYYPPDSNEGAKNPSRKRGPPPRLQSKNFREITVRVKGHPDYIVRSQRGYVPDDAEEKIEVARTPEEQIINALSAPLPLTTIGVSASADYLETSSDAAQVSLQLHIEGNDLAYRPEGDRFPVHIEVVAAVYDSLGKHVNTYSEQVRGKLSRERAELAKQTGYRYGKRIPLKPGFYQIRVGVRETSTGHIGTATTWVEVPDLSKGKLTLSDILLAETVIEGQPVLNADGNTKDSIAIQKYGIKFYKPNTELIYYLMVYNGLSAKLEARELMIKSEIYQGQEAVYIGMWQPVDSRKMGNDWKGMEVGGQIGLALESGLYQLRIKVKDAKTNTIEERSIAFGIER